MATKTQRIGIDASALAKEDPTGVEVVTRELIKHLIMLDTTSTFHLYTPQILPSALTRPSNVDARIVPYRKLWTQRALPPIVNQDNMDVFWEPSNMLPSNLKAKTIVTVHDLAVIKFPQLYTIKERLLSRLTLKRAAQKADKIIAVSLQTKKDLGTYFKIPSSRIEVIYNALPTPAPARQPKLTLPKRYLLVVGRIEPRKNPYNILKSFAQVSKIDPSLHLVFAGPPPQDLGQFANLMHKLRIQNKVRILGFVPDAHLSWLFTTAQILLFPSLYEGFGLPILQGFHFGVPVITSNFGAMSEIASGGALLVNPKDPPAIAKAIEALLLDKKLATRYISAGRQRLKDFSWEASALKLKRAIDGL